MTTEPLFDRANEYDAMLEEGLRLTGESRTYYMLGRLELLDRLLGDSVRPQRILDFGCGTGDTAAELARRYPAAHVLGVDTAVDALRLAEKRHSGSGAEFLAVEELGSAGTFDLCYTNGVFHHIPEDRREAAARTIALATRAGGVVAFFENNPWNLGTRYVMKRIPFDRTARTLSPPVARRLLENSGLSLYLEPRYLFFFPRVLRLLRPLETRLQRLPVGGQYLILATKDR